MTVRVARHGYPHRVSLEPVTKRVRLSSAAAAPEAAKAADGTAAADDEDSMWMRRDCFAAQINPLLSERPSVAPSS